MSSAVEPNVCQPIRTLQELYAFRADTIRWGSLVQPVVSRSRSRKLGEHFQEIEFRRSYVEFVENDRRPQVLLCHDFKGNYLNDKYVNGTRDAGWVDYRFYNWAAIDLFCYFSHNFVTIPTLQWLNCAHRNGVKVIGTFIVEDETAPMLRDILQSEEAMEKAANALVLVAKTCRFHGWLLNIECTLEENLIGMLLAFVRLLSDRCHREIEGSQVIWYDAITEKGLLSWQNELNSVNNNFFAACDGIFLNYSWKRQHLERTETFLRNFSDERRRLDVYVGIDVFGRGQMAKLDTYTTLETILEFGYSVAIFAPGWTYESLEEGMRREQLDPDSSNDRFLRLNNRFWNRLWHYLYVRGPKHLPFYTSFCLGSGKFRNRLGKQQNGTSWFNLGLQGFQPTIPPSWDSETPEAIHWEHSFDAALDGGCCLKLHQATASVRLFACNFRCRNDLIVSYAFQRSAPIVDIRFILKLYNLQYHDCLKIVCGSADCHVSRQRNEIRAIPVPSARCADLLHLGAEAKLPPMDEINGWEIRYYYLSFADIVQRVRIIDIGVELEKSNPDEYALLGAVHLQAGFPEQRVRISPRTEVSFTAGQPLAPRSGQPM